MDTLPMRRCWTGLVLALIGGGCAVAQAPRWERVDCPMPGPVAYDSTRNRLVALDSLGSTFEWWGVWTRVPVTGPGGSRSLVHDPVLRGTIALENTLSIYDGTSWTPFAVPGATSSVRALAFDSNRSRLVALTSAGTWEHDGNTWIQTLPVAPEARKVTYDPVRQRVMAFGNQGTLTDALFAYDGVSWTVLSTNGPPSSPAPLGFDVSRNSLILHGDPFSHFDWEWNGASWSSIPQPVADVPNLCATPIGLLSIGDNATGSVSLRLASQWV